MLDIFGCVLLPVLAWFAATVALSKSTHVIGSAWWGPLLAYRHLEGFWRIVCLHLCFAGIALAVTTPVHIHSHAVGYHIGIVCFVLGFIALAYLSQHYLNDETSIPMTAAEVWRVKQVCAPIILVYVLLMGFVVYGVLTATEQSSVTEHKNPVG